MVPVLMLPQTASGDAIDNAHFWCPSFQLSHCNTPLAQCHRQNEQEKKTAYDEWVREVEHGTFFPLVFSTSGGMGPIATVVYRRIASLIAEKQQQPYSCSRWDACWASRSGLRLAIMCLKGARSFTHPPTGLSEIGEPINLTCSWSRISLQHWLNETV